ncbi:MAG: trypsin-like serine protease [Candidatus Anammoximicrobium sp.]|nr:trypsin-like serine protease [Candidatus Anammoximicrobium sp.]
MDTQSFNATSDAVQSPAPPPARSPAPPSAGREAAPPPRPSARCAAPASRSPFTLTHVWILLGLLVVLRYVVPYLLERYQYAVTRARQQAEYDVASKALGSLQLSGLSKASQLVSQKVGPSVVHIDVSSVRSQRQPEEYAQLYGRPAEPSYGQGSGVIVDPQGYIVTNSHVVHAAAEIEVALSDGRVLPARIVGADSATDVAVLKIDADRLIAAPWGDSEELDVGALVWAVGSPFGLQSTITFGIISAKHRANLAGDVYQDFLQTDAAVNPGNSGGPLVDAQGRVIGINTAIVGDSYRGVSFAVPSSVARAVYERLKASGRLARGWLGVQLDDVSEPTARRLGLPAATGAVVVLVVDDPRVPSPAKDFGLRVNDVVIRWNGKPVGKSAELIRMVAMTEIDSTAQVELIRAGRKLTLEVRVAERPL